jgi:hypothetical protein
MESNWNGYLQALQKAKLPKSSGFENTEGNTTSTGFVEWKANTKSQEKYDAMSLKWEGVTASENAATSGMFKTNYMPVNK